MQVAKWNYNRNNTEFNQELEYTMLQEEAQEFKDGLTDYFDCMANNSDHIHALVEMIDAWADYKFVLQGAKFKALGTYKTDLSFADNTLDYMIEILCDDLEVPYHVLTDSYEAVVAANQAKGTHKVNGKIQKGDAWVDPKAVILGLLNDC